MPSGKTFNVRVGDVFDAGGYRCLVLLETFVQEICHAIVVDLQQRSRQHIVPPCAFQVLHSLKDLRTTFVASDQEAKLFAYVKEK